MAYTVDSVEDVSNVLSDLVREAVDVAVQDLHEDMYYRMVECGGCIGEMAETDNETLFKRFINRADFSRASTDVLERLKEEVEYWLEGRKK